MLGEPLGAALLAFALFGEVPSALTLAGGALVLARPGLARARRPRVKRRVHVLFTGGTIAMRIDPHTGAAVPALSGEEIAALVPDIADAAELTLEDYARLPSPHVTPHWMWRLKDRVAAVLADPAVDGVVLTHGTDTLEETAFLLDLTVDAAKPVVMCGAMRTVSEPGWDGPANLLAAVRTAVHAEARGRGVMVVVGEAIHTAAEASKWHAQALQAFRSPHGPLGTIERDGILFHRPPFAAPRLPATRLVTEVDLHTMATGVDDALVRASLARGARGLVLEATGCGNVPPAVVPGIRAALAARVPGAARLALCRGPRRPGVRLRRRRAHAARPGRDPLRRDAGAEGAHPADGRARRDLGSRGAARARDRALERLLTASTDPPQPLHRESTPPAGLPTGNPPVLPQLFHSGRPDGDLISAAFPQPFRSVPTGPPRPPHSFPTGFPQPSA